MHKREAKIRLFGICRNENREAAVDSVASWVESRVAAPSRSFRLATRLSLRVRLRIIVIRVTVMPYQERGVGGHASCVTLGEPMNATTTTTGGTADDRLTALFDVLRSRERRRIATALLDAELASTGPVPVDTVLRTTDGGEASRLRLYHAHLPRLADEGYVAWNREHGRVRAGENYDELATFVDLVRHNDGSLPEDWD